MQEMQHHAHQMADDLRDQVEHGREATKCAGGVAGEKLCHARTRVSEAGQEAADSVRGHASSASDRVKETVAHEAERLSEAAHEAYHKAAEAAERLEEMSEHAGHRVADIGGHARERAADMGDRVRERVVEMGEFGHERAAEMGERARERVEDVSRRARGHTGDTKEHVKGKLDAVKGRVEDTYHQSSEASTKLAGKGFCLAHPTDRACLYHLVWLVPLLLVISLWVIRRRHPDRWKANMEKLQRQCEGLERKAKHMGGGMEQKAMHMRDSMERNTKNARDEAAKKLHRELDNQDDQGLDVSEAFQKVKGGLMNAKDQAVEHLRETRELLESKKHK